MALVISKTLATVPALLVLSLSWLAVSALERWRCYRRARQERAQLLSFGDRDLRDIGLSRVDALRQANRSLWSGCVPSAIDLDLRRQP